MFWQDREVHFDERPKRIGCRAGEFEIATYKGVEDAQGNQGDFGTLVITTLRLVWISSKTEKLNLSIGWDTLTTISYTSITSKMTGPIEKLKVRASFGAYSFEFNFMVPLIGSLLPSPSEQIAHIHSTYNATRIYRDLKVRSDIVSAGELELLEWEYIHKRVVKVANLSSDEGAIGFLYITNIRTAWFANSNELYNVSLPHIQLMSRRNQQNMVLL